jgi:hypothetical protein
MDGAILVSLTDQSIYPYMGMPQNGAALRRARRGTGVASEAV